MQHEYSYRPAKKVVDHGAGLHIDTGKVTLAKFPNSDYLLVVQPPLDKFESFRVRKLLGDKVDKSAESADATLSVIRAERFSRYEPEVRDINALLFAEQFSELLGNRAFEGSIVELHTSK